MKSVRGISKSGAHSPHAGGAVKLEGLREFPAVRSGAFADEAGAYEAAGRLGGAVAAGPYYVPHALKLEEPPPAHAHAHALPHALYEEAEFRRAGTEPAERLERPTVVSMGS